MLTEIVSIKNVKNWWNPDDISSDKHPFTITLCVLSIKKSRIKPNIKKKSYELIS